MNLSIGKTSNLSAYLPQGIYTFISVLSLNVNRTSSLLKTVTKSIRLYHWSSSNSVTTPSCRSSPSRNLSICSFSPAFLLLPQPHGKPIPLQSFFCILNGLAFTIILESYVEIPMSFYYNTPLTIEHEIQVLKEAEFSKNFLSDSNSGLLVIIKRQ